VPYHSNRLRSRVRGGRSLPALVWKGLLFAFGFALLVGLPIGIAVGAADPACTELQQPPGGRGIIVDLHILAVNWALGWLLPDACIIRMPILTVLAIFLIVCELLGPLALRIGHDRFRRRA